VKSLGDVSWILEKLSTHQRPDVADSSLILIGGQALNFWCDNYRTGSEELDRHGPFASKDLDFQATRALVPWCSNLLGGECALAQSGDRNTLLNGVVKVPDRDGGDPLKIDFLQRPYGLLGEDTVKFSATVAVHRPIATIGVRVMHPMHCLMSRVHNVMGLPEQYANEHGFRQLDAAIVCLRLFIDDLAAQDARRALRLNEWLFEFALHDNDAARLLLTRAVDVFDAASKSDRLGEKFLNIRYPQMFEELKKRRER
jgi:hypothetical protein